MKTLKLFTAEWCPPCKVIKKSGILDKFKEQNKDIPLEVYDVDTEDGQKEAQKYEIKSIPTFVLVKDDSITKKVGLVKLEDLVDFVK